MSISILLVLIILVGYCCFSYQCPLTGLLLQVGRQGVASQGLRFLLRDDWNRGFILDDGDVAGKDDGHPLKYSNLGYEKPDKQAKTKRTLRSDYCSRLASKGLQAKR